MAKQRKRTPRRRAGGNRVNLSPGMHIEINLLKFAGRRGGGGKAKAAVGRMFGGLREAAGAARGKPVQQTRRRRQVRRPETIQAWEADRREQAELAEELGAVDTTGNMPEDGGEQ